MPVYVVDDDTLVIRVNVETLKHFIQNCGNLENACKIPDARAFAVKFSHYLSYDDDTGQTELYRCFDKIAEDMFESGEDEIIDIDDYDGEDKFRDPDSDI